MTVWVVRTSRSRSSLRYSPARRASPGRSPARGSREAGSASVRRAHSRVSGLFRISESSISCGGDAAGGCRCGARRRRNSRIATASTRIASEPPVIATAMTPKTVDFTRIRSGGPADSGRPAGVSIWMSTGNVPAPSASTSTSICSFCRGGTVSVTLVADRSREWSVDASERTTLTVNVVLFSRVTGTLPCLLVSDTLRDATTRMPSRRARTAPATPELRVSAPSVPSEPTRQATDSVAVRVFSIASMPAAVQLRSPGDPEPCGHRTDLRACT